MTALKTEGDLSNHLFKNMKIPLPEILQEMSDWSALGHMLTPKLLPLFPRSKISLKVCPLHPTVCSS